jgi:tetratricopeptide (TPR) repeat protein
MGSLHHPITTSNPEAQRFFDQGLTLVYAFNHDEAARSFRRAAELDPKSPMPWWGLALALGPNYNVDVDPDGEKAAFDAIQKAQSLAAADADSERAYVDALAARYSGDPKPDLKKLARDYSAAMGQLAKRFPDDPDASTIYAESLMDLHPWGLWKLDGTPDVRTLEIIAVLESVLARFPDHVGANHYYIHAVEASPHPAWALPSAKRLETLVPNGGHLVHMPSHIYSRVGEFDAAVKSNEAASAVDVAYIKNTGAQGVYPAMYYSHNLHFLSYAAMQAGNFAKAQQAAATLAANIRAQGQGMPDFMTAGFSAYQMEVLARFGHWTELLALPQPDSSALQVVKTWHYARGVAFAAAGKLNEAAKEQQALEADLDKIPPDLPAGFNPLKNLLTIADAALSARIAEARGDRKSAIESWRKAVAIQDQFAYDEPPDWYYSVRESLGGTLLRDAQFTEAEKVFRDDLAANPRNARSLFGLWQSLAAQHKQADADWARAEFEAAWKDSDSKLRVEDL